MLSEVSSILGGSCDVSLVVAVKIEFLESAFSLFAEKRGHDILCDSLIYLWVSLTVV